MRGRPSIYEISCESGCASYPMVIYTLSVHAAVECFRDVSWRLRQTRCCRESQQCSQESVLLFVGVQLSCFFYRLSARNYGNGEPGREASFFFERRGITILNATAGTCEEMLKRAVGGWRGIRTPGIFPNTSVFKTDSLNRSDIHPFPDRIMSHQ